MVKRWRPDVTYVTGECFAGMIHDSIGEYVEYDDYAALEAESAKLKEALRECITPLVDECEQHCDWPCDVEASCSLRFALAKAREVLGNE